MNFKQLYYYNYFYLKDNFISKQMKRIYEYGQKLASIHDKFERFQRPVVVLKLTLINCFVTIQLIPV